MGVKASLYVAIVVDQSRAGSLDSASPCRFNADQLAWTFRMNPESIPTRRSLIRDMAFFQFKLLLDALRDLVLSPLSLVAGAIDLLVSGFQPPRYFRAVLRLGERSEEWIDLWSAGRDVRSTEHVNVDALLAHVEAVVSDPKAGAHRARVLKRWAEQQAARARREKQQGSISKPASGTAAPPQAE